jgi:hypothetical protein
MVYIVTTCQSCASTEVVAADNGRGFGPFPDGLAARGRVLKRERWLRSSGGEDMYEMGMYGAARIETRAMLEQL